MDEHGRVYKVLIEDTVYEDKRTGVMITSDSVFTAYADEGLTDIIKKVAGVTNVYNTMSKTQYSIYTDPRYDFEFVK